jgi:hypothetical protein
LFFFGMVITIWGRLRVGLTFTRTVRMCVTVLRDADIAREVANSPVIEEQESPLLMRKIV